jgi:uncharacterized metal-binding protein
MAPGREHTAASVVAAAPPAVSVPLIAYGTGADVGVSLIAGVVTWGGCLAGVALSPDLDQETLTKSEWAIVKWLPTLGWAWPALWDTYARLLPHRHALSHLPIVGTAGRLAYLWAWLVLARRAIVWSVGIRVTLPAPPIYAIALFLVGLLLSDTLHWLMDGCPIHWKG